MQPGENGLAVISSMLGTYGRYVKLSELRKVLAYSRNGSTPEQLSEAALMFGLKSEILHVKPEDLKDEHFPLVAMWKRKYYCVIKKIRGNSVYIMDPSKGNVKVSLEYFEKKYSGILIRMSPNEEFRKGGKRNSIVPNIKRRLEGTGKQLVLFAILNILAVALNLVSTTVSLFFSNIACYLY